jgi:hypothetical protein
MLPQPNLHHALLFTATLQERLLCIRNLAKSYHNEFRESQDVTARYSAVADVIATMP